MKKIFTLLCCAVMAFTASAQIEIQKEDGTVVKEGETIELMAEETELFPGFSIIEYAADAPYIVNKGAGATNVEVTITKENPKDMNLSWCMSGSCTQMKTPIETKSDTARVQEPLGIALHAEFEQGKYKTTTVKVLVKAGDFTQNFNIKFVYADPTGIEAQNADKITVANKQLSYSFSNSADRVLNIYGVSGRMVKSVALTQNGNVALNDLHHGVYIYEVLTDGKRTAAHKFIVR